MGHLPAKVLNLLWGEILYHGANMAKCRAETKDHLSPVALIRLTAE